MSFWYYLIPFGIITDVHSGNGSYFWPNGGDFRSGDVFPENREVELSNFIRSFEFDHGHYLRGELC